MHLERISGSVWARQALTITTLPCAVCVVAGGGDPAKAKVEQSRAHRARLQRELLLFCPLFDVLNDVADGLQFLRILVRHFH